jgi:hypothetical protein
VHGRWTGIAVDGETAVAVDPQGTGICIDALGNKQRELTIRGASVLRSGKLSLDKPRALLAYSFWGKSLDAFSSTGEQLWSYRGGQGIDDVCAFDLDGDMLDEVIIGYNGRTGIHLLDSRRKLRWAYRQIGNVWHVSAGDVMGDDQPEIVTTSSAGKVHIFDREGQKLKDLDAQLYATLVRVGPPLAGGKAAILVGGSGRGGAGSALAGLDAEGDKRWSVALDNHIDSAQVAASRPWIAVGQRGGRVVVVDVDQGKIIARIAGQAQRPEVGWIQRSGQAPLLLMATGQGLNALAMEESEPRRPN